MTIWTHLAFWPPKQPLFGVPNELTSKCCCPGRSDRLRLAGIDGAQIGGGGTEQHAHSSAEGQGMTMFSALFLSLFWLMLNDGIMKNLLVELDVFSKNGLAMSGLDPCGVGECWFKRDRICRKLPKSTTIVSVQDFSIEHDPLHGDSWLSRGGGVHAAAGELGPADPWRPSHIKQILWKSILHTNTIHIYIYT